MFLLFFIFHFILFMEAYALYHKKLRKKGIIIGFINTVLWILNIVKWLPAVKIEYSSFNYFEQEFISNPIKNILWIMINLLGILYILILINSIKKQNKILKKIMSILCYLIITLLLILLLRNIASFVIFLSVIGAYYFLIKDYKKERTNYVFITIILLSFITWYSFFTYTGAARLQLALVGYPKEAYETGLEELKYYEEKNTKRFDPIQNFPLKEGEVGIIEVKNYIFLKFGKIYDF